MIEKIDKTQITFNDKAWSIIKKSPEYKKEVKRQKWLRQIFFEILLVLLFAFGAIVGAGPFIELFWTFIGCSIFWLIFLFIPVSDIKPVVVVACEVVDVQGNKIIVNHEGQIYEAYDISTFSDQLRLRELKESNTIYKIGQKVIFFGAEGQLINKPGHLFNLGFASKYHCVMPIEVKGKENLTEAEIEKIQEKMVEPYLSVKQHILIIFFLLIGLFFTLFPVFVGALSELIDVFVIGLILTIAVIAIYIIRLRKDAKNRKQKENSQ